MTEDVVTQKPLTEQILDELFKSIEGLHEFDAETIEQLKKVAESGELTKPPQVVKALRVITKES